MYSYIINGHVDELLCRRDPVKNTPVKIGIYCPFDHQCNDVSYEMSIS